MQWQARVVPRDFCINVQFTLWGEHWDDQVTARMRRLRTSRGHDGKGFFRLIGSSAKIILVATLYNVKFRMSSIMARLDFKWRVRGRVADLHRER